MISDRYGRPLTSMRISITQRCNLDCIYCHREGVFDSSDEEMTPEEIARITKVCVKGGIRKVKITGGEPLIRDDVCEIVRKISSIPGIEDVSMTTNGVLLEDYAEELKKSGLTRINVSLDTLRPETFAEITNGGDLARVINGIEKAIAAGLKPVKLNMVVMKGINDREIGDMMRHYSREGVVLQLIELMDTDKAFFARYFYDLDDIEREFEKKATDVVVRKFMQGRRKYIFNGAQVEVIKPMHNSEFCAHCTRIRITADGKFKPCLMRSDNTVDFLVPMRNGATDAELYSLFLKAVENREPYFKEKI
jgi:cyclic pyranopterin phosphate synthase